MSRTVERATAVTDRVPARLVAMIVSGQHVALNVAQVRDVLGPLPMTRVPRAPAEVAGVLNLRGHIVTAIDLAVRLGMSDAGPRATSVVVEHEGDLYAILVDQVEEVVHLESMGRESDLGLLSGRWRDTAAAIYRRPDGPLIELDVPRLLHSGAPT
jgi:purine-binding chemotaxis protein CheW